MIRNSYAPECGATGSPLCPQLRKFWTGPMIAQSSRSPLTAGTLGAGSPIAHSDPSLPQSLGSNSRRLWLHERSGWGLGLLRVLFLQRPGWAGGEPLLGWVEPLSVVEGWHWYRLQGLRDRGYLGISSVRELQPQWLLGSAGITRIAEYGEQGGLREGVSAETNIDNAEFTVNGLGLSISPSLLLSLPPVL